MKKPTILIVDDDDAHRAMLRTVLRGWDYAADEADDGDTAVEMVRERAYDAIISDVRMARMDGICALREILHHNPAIPVLVMTAWSSVETAVEALRLGAYDYLSKPLDFDVLKHTLNRALEHTWLVAENRELRRCLDGRQDAGILGQSRCMTELADLLKTVAPTDATVLITGESGTGKELVARAIQQGSERRDRAFVTVNCAALGESLLESELFGHEKGAFTGADKRREGRFKQADGGTLFLDEIGELPLQLQAKLLRALQQGEVQRVGSDTPVMVNVRVIAATNRNLRAEVDAGRFREDLYYRLNVIGLDVPPLRERKEDIPLLSSAFLERYSLANRKAIKGFTPQAMDALLKYNWPGNVRELQNAVERAVILCAGDYVSERELPLAVSSSPKRERDAEKPETGISCTMNMHGDAQGDGDRLSVAVTPGMTLDALERALILNTLRETGDNKSEAARRLGITRATLHNKLKRYDME